MPENESLTITCENCGHSIAVEKALRERLEEGLRAETLRTVTVDLARKHEDELKRQKAADEKVAAERLAAERRRSEDAVERERGEVQKAKEEAVRAAAEAEQLRKDADAGRTAMLAAKTKEEALARREADVELRQLEWKAEQSRKMVSEVLVKAEAIAAQRLEQERVNVDAKAKEKDERIQTLEDRIKRLRDSTEKRDGRTIGEGQEMALEALLKERFRQDDIRPVPKGEPGADVLQGVLEGGVFRGLLCWESKKTQVFQQGYLEKLRADMKDNGADLGVLVSTAFPADMKEESFFSPEDRLIIIRPHLAPVIAEVMRRRIVEVAKQKDISQMRPEAAQKVFDTVTSPQFFTALSQIAKILKELQARNEEEYRALAQVYLDRQKMVFDLAGGLFEVAGMTLGMAGAGLPSELAPLRTLAKFGGNLPEPKKRRGRKARRGVLDGELDLDEEEDDEDK